MLVTKIGQAREKGTNDNQDYGQVFCFLFFYASFLLNPVEIFPMGNLGQDCIKQIIIKTKY